MEWMEWMVEWWGMARMDIKDGEDSGNGGNGGNSGTGGNRGIDGNGGNGANGRVVRRGGKYRCVAHRWGSWRSTGCDIVVRALIRVEPFALLVRRCGQWVLGSVFLFGSWWGRGGPVRIVKKWHSQTTGPEECVSA